MSKDKKSLEKIPIESDSENKESQPCNRRKLRVNSVLNLVDIPRGVRINTNIDYPIVTKTFHN